MAATSREMRPKGRGPTWREKKLREYGSTLFPSIAIHDLSEYANGSNPSRFAAITDGFSGIALPSIAGKLRGVLLSSAFESVVSRDSRAFTRSSKASICFMRSFKALFISSKMFITFLTKQSARYGDWPAP